MNTLDLQNVSQGELITFIVEHLPANVIESNKPVAALPMRGALEIQDFVKRQSLVPFASSDGVLFGLYCEKEDVWDYASLTVNADGALVIEIDEGMPSVEPVILSGDVTSEILIFSLLSVFTKFKTFEKTALAS